MEILSISRNKIRWILFALITYILLPCKSNLGNLSNQHQIFIKQLTNSAKNHELCVFGLFSPDDQWIVYSCGPNESNDTIGKVNVDTGSEEIIYKIANTNEYGPGCGTVSFCDTEDKIIFIHGPFNSTEKRRYEFWRRAGAVVNSQGEFYLIDARDVTFPFTKGALRGGTHCHEWSSDGQWVSFTYNDAIMAEIESKTGKNVNLRTVGISRPYEYVEVDEHPENHDGKWFSALVVEVVPNPQVGTDQISRACNNGWIGTKGYQKPDGGWQRAIAFMGKTVRSDGKELMEVYIVDVPENITKADEGKKLEGTMNEMPAVAKNTVQKRITRTENRKFPGICLNTRHWLRSSRDGSKIGYLAKDNGGVVQAFYVSPIDCNPVQITKQKSDIKSSVFWSPDGDYISYICDNSIFITRVDTSNSIRITSSDQETPFRAVWSRKGDKIVFARNVTNSDGNKYSQIFIAEITPDILADLKN